MTRQQFADALGFPIETITRIMGDLKKCGAVSSQRVRIDGVRGPGMVRYFMNPNVATHLSGKARDMAQEAAPKVTHPCLTLVGA